VCIYEMRCGWTLVIWRLLEGKLPGGSSLGHYVVKVKPTKPGVAFGWLSRNAKYKQHFMQVSTIGLKRCTKAVHA